jgi:predicted metal-dependent phosphoesterase TrpH
VGVVDLHLHTTASDGRLSPAAMVRFVAQRGLRVVSITDHDSVEGLSEAFEAVGAYPNLELIAGVELSCDVPGTEVHLLGYFINYSDRQFQAMLERFRNGRIIRARRILEKLAEMSMPLEWSRVQELAGNGSVGRPHIAQAMLEKRYINEFREAFDRYIGRNGPAYVEREKLVPVEAVRLVRDVGGLPVLAHPFEIPDVERWLQELAGEGLVGLEVYYGTYTAQVVQQLNELAKQYELVPCGGSDYHALGTPDEVLPGVMGPKMESVRQLKTRLSRKARARNRGS